jgi:hypothetical protein
MEARRDKVTAERHLAEARSAQRAAIRAVAKARRELEAVESLRRSGAPSPARDDRTPPPAGPATEKPST